MITLVIGLVALAVLVAGYVAWLSARFDRLTARAEAASAALDAQLVRRAGAGLALATRRGEPALMALATAALEAAGPAMAVGREELENALSREMRRCGYDELTAGALPPEEGQLLTDLSAAAGRVRLARQFHNGAVRDLLSMRRRRTARLARLGRHTPVPSYFEIDDALLALPGRSG